ncbi:KH domain-containing protein [Bdellovibrio sp. BCCA]|uniref:KH domain-containing protein n=1 Tax=Bdellovibrio sp. BCCA TaxID=3136281 RepID=UPI0030F3149F
MEIKVIKMIRKSNLASEPAQTEELPPEGELDHREETRELLESIIKSIVDVPSSVRVTYDVGARTTVFKVDCCRESIGRLIGTKGRCINALRVVISSIMAMHGMRAIIEIPYYAPKD